LVKDFWKLPNVNLSEATGGWDDSFAVRRFEERGGRLVHGRGSLAEVDYWTTHDVMQAESLPKSLIVLGGGAVGCELGQVLRRFGVDITMVEAADRLLPAEEPEASQTKASR
jgi:pyruvate/2-oxoglutarate dehydrogenase complex dihydrolipoamide dehydrogenase (E3) component